LGDQRAAGFAWAALQTGGLRVLIFATKASAAPPFVAWTGLAVGKFVEFVSPAT